MSIESMRRATTAPIEVLHIDDDPAVLDLTESFFDAESETCTVATASDPDDGLDRLDAGAFHCVISDYEMPGCDGLELLDRVRERYPDLPFVLYTGKGSEEIAAEAINAGVTGYLQKGGPDQIRRLINRVSHAVAEYRTRIESERYSTVLRALDYPVYVVNEAAELEYVNRAFVDLTGYDRAEIIGSTPGMIKAEEAVETANGMLADIVSSNGPSKQKFKIDIQTADGETVPCYDHMAALPFDEAFRGSVGILRDATAEQRRREELLRQNDRLDEFTSVVSRDLRESLANVRTAADSARTTVDGGSFDRLEAELDRTERMIEDLLTLVREGRAVSESEPVDVAAIASEAWESCRRGEDALERPAEELSVDADPSRLRQLLGNLMRNAVEHAVSPVTVTIDSSDEGFYVADDGPGIDEARRDEVFEPGYTTTDDGTGFGLPIVRRIADAHGWDVAVTESGAGGARFEFRTDPKPRAATETPLVRP